MRDTILTEVIVVIFLVTSESIEVITMIFLVITVLTESSAKESRSIFQNKWFRYVKVLIRAARGLLTILILIERSIVDSDSCGDSDR